MACCGNSPVKWGAPAAARVWTVVQGDTRLSVLSEGEAVVERARLTRADPDTPAVIYSPGTTIPGGEQ